MILSEKRGYFWVSFQHFLSTCYEMFSYDYIDYHTVISQQWTLMKREASNFALQAFYFLSRHSKEPKTNLKFEILWGLVEKLQSWQIGTQLIVWWQIVNQLENVERLESQIIKMSRVDFTVCYTRHIIWPLNSLFNLKNQRIVPVSDE